MAEIDKYWEAIQKNVCAHCIDSDGKGFCRVASATECGLKQFFPAIVNTVLSVQSENLGPYVRALRENICSVCEHQSADGACLVRAEVECGLDRYFPIIVESIEGFKFPQPVQNTDNAGNQ